MSLSTRRSLFALPLMVAVVGCSGLFTNPAEPIVGHRFEAPGAKITVFGADKAMNDLNRKAHADETYMVQFFDDKLRFWFGKNRMVWGTWSFRERGERGHYVVDFELEEPFGPGHMSIAEDMSGGEMVVVGPVLGRQGKDAARCVTYKGSELCPSKTGVQLGQIAIPFSLGQHRDDF